MQSGSAGNGGAAAAGAVRSDINVTPLVDVCLVLLIIFMVVTPLLTQGADVNLPDTNKPEKMPEGAKQLDVAVKADGSVIVGQNWVPSDQLLARLKEKHDQDNEATVVIKGDRRAKYSQVRDVMKVLNDAGFTGVGLEMHKKEAAAGG
jgi:biopolymer transport protein ExbD